MSENNKSVPDNRLPPEERYRRDSHFATLVNVLESMISQAEYTPTELREAVMLAAIRYESRNVHRQIFLSKDEGIRWIESKDYHRFGFDKPATKSQ